MLVSDAMTEVILSVGPGHTLRQAAEAMWERRVGRRRGDRSRRPGPGPDHRARHPALDRAGSDPDAEHVADHLTARLTFASPGWSLEQAAATMVRGGFRHLVVVDGAEMVGILSMRDIVRVWSGEGASCDVPPSRDPPRCRERRGR